MRRKVSLILIDGLPPGGLPGCGSLAPEREGAFRANRA